MFITGTTSVLTVQAYLTDKGKEILHKSIGTNSPPLITKFAFGDSDTNYKAIDAGTGALKVGCVPEGSSFKPVIRGVCLSKGSYRPGKPVVYVNDDNSLNHTITMVINRTETSETIFNLKTEWPYEEAFSEGYDYYVVLPPNIHMESFNTLFDIENLGSAIRVFYKATVGNVLDFGVLQQLKYSNFSIVVTGQFTNLSVTVDIDVQ